MAAALSQCGVKPVNAGLLVTDPRHQFQESVFKLVFRGIAQQTPGLRDVGNAMTDVTGSELSACLGFHFATAHRPAEVKGYIPHGDGVA